MDRRELISKIQSYGLSFAAAVDIADCVEAYQNYVNLPQATIDSVQIIADMFNVNFSFVELKRGKIALIGIWTELKSSYLYTNETLEDRKKKKHWKTNYKTAELRVGANEMLSKWE